MSHPHSIHVPIETRSESWAAMLSIIENLLPVKFDFSREPGSETAGQVIAEGLAARPQSGELKISSLAVPLANAASGERELVEIVVRFSDDPNVPFPFRARSLRTKVATAPRALSLSANELPLATCELGPVWAVSNQAGVKHFRSAFGLPDLPAQGSLQDVLGGHRFLEMLPVIHWLREICASTLSEGPPLRACFIFDDPNLHWPRYGFVDYRQIAAHAAKENYHVSFATIPLDTWFTHQKTAALFRSSKDQLSLLVHGNNHTKKELAQNYTEVARKFLLTQAIHRIERLERRAGFAIPRVMVPPHGACSEAMLGALPDCGFEAACISHGSLRAHNRDKVWTRNLGYCPSELINGCPVLPRWGVSGDLTNTILLAAFLKQAIILRGHHQDLKEGVELLDSLARAVNSLGSVSWTDMGALVKANYEWRMEKNTCKLRPLGLKAVFPVPSQASNLVIENPRRDFQRKWRIRGASAVPATVSAGEIIVLPRPSNNPLFIEEVAPEIVTHNGEVRWVPPTVVFRRLLTEGRDRLLG